MTSGQFDEPSSLDKKWIAVAVLALALVLALGGPVVRMQEEQDEQDAALTASPGVVSAIAAGSNHSIALKDDGTVWTWGANSRGQLGDGTTADHFWPVQVSGLTDAIAVTGGGRHTVALKNDGTVWCWGDNSFGQLGDRTRTFRRAPIQVSGLINTVAIAAGGSYDSYGSHTLAVRDDGTVWAWGDNAHGQLGDGTTTGHLSPVQVSGLTDVIAVAAGVFHSLGVRRDGTVWAWGHNFSGQLGDGTRTDRLTPVQAIGLKDVVDVDGGSTFSLALKRDGKVFMWGSLVGQSYLMPVYYQLNNVMAIASGYWHAVALKRDGTVWGWGKNEFGQLGDGTSSSADYPLPVKAKEMADVIAIDAGDRHTIALKRDHTVWAWGRNNFGQVGDTGLGFRVQPVQVSGL